VLVFQTKPIWQHVRDPILDARLGSANLTAQNGIQNSIAVASELLVNRQFTSVTDAAKQGHHIPGELMKLQVALFGGCRLPLVFLRLDHIHPLARLVANS
jgi:hypothetical protein